MTSSLPRSVSHNLVHKSAFVSWSRGWAFVLGYVYANVKLVYLTNYVATEDAKKVAQLSEAGINMNTLRGLTFHAPSMWDPQYTEKQMKMRDCYPEYYLHPFDEFVYQTTRGQKRREQS